MRPESLKVLLSGAQNKGDLSGQLSFDVSMSRYTTWRIGGQAECLYRPDSIADLQRVFVLLPQETEIHWLGLGSNILIRDGGLRGIVICTNGVLNHFDIKCDELTNHCLISAQAGMSSAVFSRKAANEGVDGAEFLSGIPGTIGGALAMNAGAFGSEIWSFVKKVTMINRRGEILSRMAEDFNIGYRHIELKDQSCSVEREMQWFVQADFMFNKDTEGLKKSKQEIKLLLAKRATTQPTKQASAGSVFKNPENDFAARLIEFCGLKGLSVNDAQISEKHANFIINNSNASASDVEALINKIQEVVLKQCHVKLETEVCIMGQA
ncbi:MAG: UDP-N-acetylmuramate dehydrogenase [gamma proteobacterium symbiont of Taylorina sp.]|nr:UDP-N-acetylmuramate dehydrogenase [gamma proteobacterium symbiont of Taylorina sp.]